jgi:hypothetical protein
MNGRKNARFGYIAGEGKESSLTNKRKELKAMVKEKKQYRPLVYICSPYSGDTDGNTKDAARYSRFAVDAGAIPLTPHLMLPQFMKEDSERELALFMDLIFLGKCDELWVFGENVSPGMKTEIDRAKQRHMTIRYFTGECREE